jgi:hypothetical protein
MPIAVSAAIIEFVCGCDTSLGICRLNCSLTATSCKPRRRFASIIVVVVSSEFDISLPVESIPVVVIKQSSYSFLEKKALKES